eukprot:232596-Pleurochrysis_carterae.AAC.1
MAQNADEGIEYKTNRGAQLVAHSDSDWAVAHSATGFCIMHGGGRAVLRLEATALHIAIIDLSSTEAEIVAASHTAAE